MIGKYDAFFKAYDVRGKLPEVDEKLFYLIGKGLVENVLKPEGLPLTVNVTYDVREKSEIFARYVIRGIIDAGGDVVYLGLASTDFLYAACVLDNNPGVQLTASHNPREYHGIKLVKQAPQMIGMESGLADIKQFVNDSIDTDIPDLTELVGVDQSARQRVKEYFVAKLKEVGATDAVNTMITTLQAASSRTLRIVADCGNGAAGVYMPWIAELYPNIEFVPLYWEPDGTFPNHPADPQNYTNLKDLQRAIKEHNADFGIAFDGDGDRAALVDEQGVPVDGDFLVCAFAEAFLSEYKVNPMWQKDYNPVVATIQPNSRCVWETIGENDGVGVICKQGHTYVKSEMERYNALYGGEYSNHHYFGQLKGMDSGAIPLTLFIKMYVESGAQTVSEMFARWSSRYFLLEPTNLHLPEGTVWADWKVLLKEAFKDGVQSEFDGLSVYYPDWKFSMRSSNTEPVVRFMLETRGDDLRVEKVNQIKSILGLV